MNLVGFLNAAQRINAIAQAEKMQAILNTILEPSAIFCASSVSWGFPTWDWLNLLGLVLVVIGVVAEFWMLKNKLPEEHARLTQLREERHKSEKRAAFLVALGVSLELIVFPHGLLLAARLNAANLELRDKVVALEDRQKPRRITLKDRLKFIRYMDGITKGPIRVAVRHPDFETSRFEQMVKSLLIGSGFKIIAENNISDNTSITPEPASIMVMVQQADTAPAFAFNLVTAFRGIGIQTYGVTNVPMANGYIPSGNPNSASDVVIFVLEKP